ncbi:ROK family protein [Georgenia sp. AZ-5]|uniref:ROK family protein n=1 Tax=Georgenia sp. AZ-5 TaxID=3367526 RepID=UPI003754004F
MPGSNGRWTEDQLDSMVRVLELVRAGTARTRPEIARVSGLGRTVVTQRVEQLIRAGLLRDGSLAPSTGGRAARRLELNAEVGYVLVGELGATSIDVGLSDLAGNLLAQEQETADVADGPEPVLSRVHELFSELLERTRIARDAVWGVGLGLPGPVEFASGRPVSPPIMPGWDGFDVRGFFAGLGYAAPVWVDNDVNVMALGELRGGLAMGERDVVYVKIGSGIGAGLVSQGRLHRGAQGGAGDIGHTAVVSDAHIVCRCGKVGCLEAVAGGQAIARDGRSAAEDGSSPRLAKSLAERGKIRSEDVAEAAAFGDRVAIELLARSAVTVGEVLARIVNFFNPSLILLGGGVTSVGDGYLAQIRQTVLSRSLPLATRELHIMRSLAGDQAGLRGAAYMVVDELLSPERLLSWINEGSPAGRPELVEGPLGRVS